jgi:hypothetical protein
VAAQALRCAQAFAELLELTKKHKARNQLLGTALKQGGGFIDALVKAADFWHAYFIEYGGKPFQQLLKTVQKGTKIMQVGVGVGPRMHCQAACVLRPLVCLVGGPPLKVAFVHYEGQLW